MSLLNSARVRAGLSLDDIARTTRLSRRIVAAIDRECFDELPAGIYAKTAVRAYADAVGLEPGVALAALQPQLPEAPLDLLALAELRKQQRPNTGFRPLLAATVDAGVLLLIVSAIVIVCSWVLQLVPTDLLRSAPLAMAILCSTPVVLYFWLLGATDVRTLGPWLLDIEILPHSQEPLSLRRWLRRGFAYVAQEVACAMLRDSAERVHGSEESKSGAEAR